MKLYNLKIIIANFVWNESVEKKLASDSVTRQGYIFFESENYANKNAIT